MRIRTKVIALIVALFIVLAVAQFAIEHLLLMPSFTALERQHAHTDMTRVIHAVTRELNDLSESAQGFGNWADSYEYMADRNPEFAKNNLHLGSVIAVSIEVLVLMDTRGNYVWAAGLKPGTTVSGDNAERMAIDLVTAGVLPKNHPWRAALERGTAVNGLLKTDRGILLAAMTPVLDGHGRGPHRGAVIFGRFLTPAEVAKLAVQAETELRMLDTVSRSATEKGTEDSLIERHDVTEVYHTFTDIVGVPIVTLRSSSPRSITAKGATTDFYASLFLLGGGALVLTFLVWALNRTVIAPLNQLTQYAVDVGENGTNVAPLSMDRSDELGALGAEIKQMLERLGHAHRELVERSFDAGVAEMASGTLHNIGNAMTPLAVHASSLSQLLRNAPTADVELALQELSNEYEEGARNSERYSNLLKFLRLTGTELVRVVKDAEREMQTIERQAQAVQEALAVQRSYTGNGTARESVALDQVLERSIEIVPPALRAAMDIQIDPSLLTAGPVRTSRTILQQVFQNLIVNAAEAVLGSGRVQGRLRISATAQKNADELVIRFDDDGPGVTEEVARRIFSRGFSTKSQSTNSGIGLHWCANALSAVGGRIGVVAGSFNSGACIEVALPLDRRHVHPLTRAA